ncbi:Fpg/Nei family DNA glycosylase [Amycolatopsis taiwanensis]|uniref:Fpg/Nei family DNA glycosylase n=1 Tax=Amycolatopsis taiwanensis TaxID=342230 RepID=UPI000484873F|nr:DNA-formamidopyrimidine glycosylase family protein [Amycolatopsis taiwanensis]
MPELPDVESFRRVFASHAVGPPVRRVDVLDTGVLRDVTADRLSEALVGRRFTEPRRRGKLLLAPAGPLAVVLHFGMTGSLHWAGPGQDVHRHDRVVFAFPDGELRYRDMRKLQGLRLVEGTRGVDEVLTGVGPDATEMSRDRLGELLGGRRQVKATLTDQSVIAGIGNLLADEILWRARINPRTSGVHLGRDDLVRLDAAMSSVLRQSIEAGRVPTDKSWLTGRRDEPSGSCPRCGTTLVHERAGGRATTWCPRCQPR